MTVTAAPDLTRPTLMDRIRTHASKKRAGERDAGVLMLDILIGFTLLAVFLMQGQATYGKLRQRGYELNAQADATQLATVLETYLTDTQTLPADLAALTTLIATSDYLVNLTDNNVIDAYVGNVVDGEFSFCIEHDAASPDAFAEWDSATGGITDSGKGSGCV